MLNRKVPRSEKYDHCLSHSFEKTVCHSKEYHINNKPTNINLYLDLADHFL